MSRLVLIIEDDPHQRRALDRRLGGSAKPVDLRSVMDLLNRLTEHA
jgi:CheY-like chemotaxis protein